MKLLHKTIGQVPTLIRELKKDDAAAAAERQRIKDVKEKTLEETEKKGIVKRGLKIGRHRFEEHGLNFVEDTLPERAEGGLRDTKVASALMDRVKSIYRRNMCELPPQLNGETLTRVRKRGRRKERSNKNKERSLLLA